MLIDCIAEMLGRAYGCPCNYGQAKGPDLSEILVTTHSEKWFEDHCTPELNDRAEIDFAESFVKKALISSLNISSVLDMDFPSAAAFISFSITAFLAQLKILSAYSYILIASF